MSTRRSLLLALGALLGGCGFRPMLAAVDDPGVRSELVAIEVRTPVDRLGHLVRDSVLGQLNPTGAKVPARYRLDVNLTQRTSALGIQLDNTITRFNLTVTARFRLLDTDHGRVLYQATVRRIASYNAVNDPFAELTAELDAERDAAREVGTDIRTQLAIHFARAAEAA